ncbi:LemA family protein [candidate division KSB1 bacterium]|nr:LemA family protein [candidate division KSB1 bacterium]
MTKGTKTGIGCLIIIIVLAVILFSVVKGIYNDLVTRDEQVNNSWAQVENQLKRRYDLIPNLVETVKGFAQQERDVLIGVTEARASVGQAQSPAEQIEANNALSGALSRLMVVVERYPELKSDQNFLKLQDELAGTENRIAVERGRYNESVQVLNQKIRSFPTVLFAGILGFEQREYFDTPAAEEAAPQVDFTR